MLQHELNRVEDLLSTTRAERDEIGIKYNAISERVGHYMLNHILYLFYLSDYYIFLFFKITL